MLLFEVWVFCMDQLLFIGRRLMQHWITSFMDSSLFDRWLEVNKAKFLALFVILTRTYLTTLLWLTVSIFQAPIAEFEVTTLSISFLFVLRVIYFALAVELTLAHVADWVSDLTWTSGAAVVVRKTLSVTENLIKSVLFEIRIVLVHRLVIFYCTFCPKSMIINSIGFVEVWLSQVPNPVQRLVKIPMKSPSYVFMGLSSRPRRHYGCEHRYLNQFLHFY